jgi:hypothetical protein
MMDQLAFLSFPMVTDAAFDDGGVGDIDSASLGDDNIIDSLVVPATQDSGGYDITIPDSDLPVLWSLIK